jgi:hypothetical protein
MVTPYHRVFARLLEWPFLFIVENVCLTYALDINDWTGQGLAEKTLL